MDNNIATIGEQDKETVQETEAQVADAEQAEESGISFEMDVPESPLTVAMRDRELYLVLSNLLSNAVKYTEQGGVTVALNEQEGTAAIRVTDTGIGIPETDIPSVFGEFYRASNARKSGIDGSGVGLASVKFIVERAGGSIDFESREGKGTTFTVKLPLT